ncbi:DUF6801 domain-containing protein [Streptomyces boncukensis]|uniref:DUF6801 domain-containing protein n=1 Tax=Streptomyces boncukensis TaxID=2711219 RepID=UPI0030BA0B9E
MAYVCETASPGPEHTVLAEISTRFPKAGVPRQPLRPDGVTVRVTLPRRTVSALFPDAAGGIGGIATLSTAVTQRGERAVADWKGLTAPPVHPPGGGALVLRHRGPVPPVTVEAPGDVIFTAGKLVLDLQSLPRDPASGTGGARAGREGEPSAPAAARLTCAPRPGDQNLLLATVPVAPAPDGSATPSPSGDPSGSSGPSDSTGPSDTRGSGGPGSGSRRQDPAPDGRRLTVGPAADADVGDCPSEAPDVDLDERRLPEPPPGAVVRDGTPFPLCVVPVGYATVRKQGSAMIVNDPARRLGLLEMAYLKRTVQTPDGRYTESDSAGLIELPDARSTFLAFDFQPVTARVEFEAGPATVVNINRGGAFSTAISYDQTIRLHDVAVNGVPLDVGPRCRTARPFTTELSGDYSFLTGGLVEGEVTIPPFSGCGTGGEDLDPLFTAAVSGPGNRLTIRQGVPCTAAACRDQVPELPEL